jgi:hypothetical protein
LEHSTPAHTDPAPAALQGLEGWLRRPSRLVVLAVGFVALATAINTIGTIERRIVRGVDVPLFRILGSEALDWTLLVALATPLGYAAVRFGRARATWQLVPALVVASTFVAGLLLVQQVAVARRFADFERPQRPEGDAGREGPRDGTRSPEDDGRARREFTPAEREAFQARMNERGGPRPGGGRGFGGPQSFADSLRFGLRFRFPRVLLATWAFVGLGAAMRLFLDARERERDARRLQLRTSALEGELAVAQLESLRAQLHPHFLFNALHSIGGLVRGGRDEDALRTLDALGGLLRRGLEARGDGFVTLAEELELLERYLDVERIRLGARLRVEIDVPEANRDDEVPLFVLQPLVENAVRCAVAERSEGGRVRVSARAQGHSLVIDVDDDGPGFPARVLAGEGWGIGLSNVRARLATLFEQHGRLELSRADIGGARARVTLPRDADDPLAGEVRP